MNKFFEYSVLKRFLKTDNGEIRIISRVEKKTMLNNEYLVLIPEVIVRIISKLEMWMIFNQVLFY